jgi:hypothetical protein
VTSLNARVDLRAAGRRGFFATTARAVDWPGRSASNALVRHGPISTDVLRTIGRKKQIAMWKANVDDVAGWSCHVNLLAR